MITWNLYRSQFCCSTILSASIKLDLCFCVEALHSGTNLYITTHWHEGCAHKLFLCQFIFPAKFPPFWWSAQSHRGGLILPIKDWNLQQANWFFIITVRQSYNKTWDITQNIWFGSLLVKQTKGWSLNNTALPSNDELRSIQLWLFSLIIITIKGTLSTCSKRPAVTLILLTAALTFINKSIDDYN